MDLQNNSKLFIVYCSIAGFIAAWAISGLLVAVDLASGTPVGTFFSAIGISLGFDDPSTAQYVGFTLHVLTGLVAGNIFGQFAVFWRKVAPYNYKHGIVVGTIVGIALWAVLFVPLATFGIEPRLESYRVEAPNQYVFNIASNFEGLYPVIIGGSFAFHIVYGVLLGLASGRMNENGVFKHRAKETAVP